MKPVTSATDPIAAARRRDPEAAKPLQERQDDVVAKRARAMRDDKLLRVRVTGSAGRKGEQAAG